MWQTKGLLENSCALVHSWLNGYTNEVAFLLRKTAFLLVPPLWGIWNKSKYWLKKSIFLESKKVRNEQANKTLASIKDNWCHANCANNCFVTLFPYFHWVKILLTDTSSSSSSCSCRTCKCVVFSSCTHRWNCNKLLQYLHFYKNTKFETMFDVLINITRRTQI